MAIITNTATRYGVNGIREDFSDIIYSICAHNQQPFISNMSRRRKATNTIFEWQIDSLASAASNAQIDGDDLSSFTAITATTKLSNVTMISRKDAVIADNLNGAIDQAGLRSQLAYQITKKGNELKRDMEFNLVGVNTAAVSGAAGTARKTASLSAWLTSNVSRGTGVHRPHYQMVCQMRLPQIPRQEISAPLLKQF